MNGYFIHNQNICSNKYGTYLLRQRNSNILQQINKLEKSEGDNGLYCYKTAKTILKFSLNSFNITDKQWNVKKY